MQMTVHGLKYSIAFPIQAFNSMFQFFKAAIAEHPVSLNLKTDWHRGAAHQAATVTVSFSA